MTVYLRHSTINESTSHKPGMAKPLPLHRNGFYRRGGKIVFDWLLVLTSLPIVIPLVGILAILVALDGATPFYRQRRVGRNGKVFQMLKLRTMVPNAEQVLEEYLVQNPEARREWDRDQKLRDDPRITRLGRFLRKASFDELPQLWNVLSGDMSLIGPRPMMVCQQALYPNPGLAYYRLRPGITGLWQVSDRNESSFADRATFDGSYYNDLSLKADLSIFVRTISVVTRATGY